MRCGYLGHVLVFVAAVRYAICLFVCAVCAVFRLIDTFAGVCCYLLRGVMYAWWFSWSCLGVCGRCSLCKLLLCLRMCMLLVLHVLSAMFDGLCC